MSHNYGLLFRMVLVLAMGGGMTALAVHPGKPKIAASADLPKPIVLSVAIDDPLPEFCLVPPREDKDQAANNEQLVEHGKPRMKKKIIACG